jgi:serine/threonine protein kinase/Tol biopolymer transport system component
LIGTTISHYKIVEKLGEGGMGVVYKAEDTQLRRTVALKFLSSETVDNEEVKARLIREAQAAASLEHPNVCPIYGIHEEDGESFIVMAYVDGSALSEKIKERPLPLDEAVNMAVQIAEGLQEAHEHGVVHRDVKPANVMLDRKGRVKILDFGLAAVADRTRLTKEGTTLGTPAYMSPEQAQGGKIDRRTDIWALGVILYEMLTGKHPFPGDYEQAVMYGIINEDPEPVTALRSGVPPKVDDLIAKALAKSPDERYQQVEEMLVDLRGLIKNLVAGSTPRRAAPSDAGVRLSRTAMAFIVVLAIGAAWFLASRVSEGERSPIPTAWSEPRRITSDSGLTFQPAISRDGTLMAYASDRTGEGNLDIWLQHTAGGEPIQITHDPADDTAPHFSPDGKSIAFRSERGEGGVYVTPSLGGFERFVAPRGHRPRFSPDGQWIAYFTGSRGASSLLFPISDGEAYVVPTAGGTPQRLAADALSERSPVWSPDGAALLLATAQGSFDATDEWRIVTLDGVNRGATGALAVIEDSAASQAFVPLFPDHWDSDGFVYFSSRDADSTDLWRIRVSAESARVVGKPERVLPGPGAYWGPSISEDGRLVFAGLAVNPDIWSLSVDAARGVAAADESVRLTTAQGSDTHPSVSLDGSQVAFVSNRSGKDEVWILEVPTGDQRPVTEVRIPVRPVLSANGSRLVVRKEGLAILSLDGIVEKQFPDAGYTWHWSPDDALILFGRLEGRHRPIFLLDVDSGETTKLLSDEQQSFFQGQFSPDGRWMAWQTRDVWTAPFRGAQPIPRSEWVKISEDGAFADKPRWSPDGNLLYYTSDRDGFVCIYAQPLDPDTKEPRGELLEIYHSHQARLSIGNVGMPSLELGVARDKIVFGMAELTGNIWMMEPVDGVR